MRALLIIAHGSRLETSNDEVRALTRAVAGAADGDFDLVDCAFLELTDPLVPEGIDALVHRGAREVRLLPYFLAAGRHVVDDLPELLTEARLRHPRVRFDMTRYLGQTPGVVTLLAELARSPVTGPAADPPEQ